MNIALLGTAPSSRNYAPFSDKNWEIWACSPANMDLPRIDAFFEIHSMELLDRDLDMENKLFIAWIQNQKKLYLQHTKDPRFKNAIEYPLKPMLEKFGPYFFTSSLSYMFALAIEQKPEKIGLWGVDMSATEEYGYQRAGCHYFIQKAREAGIEIVVPPESDLLEPSPLYGYREENRMWRKLHARKQELQGVLNDLRQKRIAAASQETQYMGALDDLTYIINTFPNAV